MKDATSKREAYQRAAFSQALGTLRDLVSTRSYFSWQGAASASTFERALTHLLHALHAEPLERPPVGDDAEKALADALQQVGVMYREVTLDGGWQHRATGAMLARTRDGDYVSLLPALGGYRLYDHLTGEAVRVGKKEAETLCSRAYLLYPPLPRAALTKRDLGAFLLHQLSWADVAGVALATLLVTLLGLVMPKAIQLMYTNIIPGEYANVLLPLCVLLCCVPLSILLLRVVRGICVQRVQTRLSVFSYAAVMGRLLQLPVSFFRRYDPGDLSKRIAATGSLSGTLADTLLTTGLSALFSLVYLSQISAFAPAFLLPAALITLASIGISALTVLRQVRYATQVNLDDIALSSELYDYLSDIRKIKLSGVERLVFAGWTNAYTAAAARRYNRPFLLRMGAALSEAVMSIGMLVIYLIAANSGTSVANFIAFTASFGLLMGALGSIVLVLQNIAQMAPDFRTILPVLQAVPEKQPLQKTLASVEGNLRLEHVSFRYAPDLPYVLEDISLDIPAGQYVGIVGRTGCGKSTLLRLLLGFETPERGTVYVDDNSLASVNPQSYRRNLGIVLQDGSLIAGTIFENITLAAPWLSAEDTWRAARVASIDEDIRRLPMGMRTMISARSSGVSGGQKQRLMIARAVASNPSVLLLDEATSSLDNETQARIAEALDALDCTRIVVAHRLSTVERCDRIIVLDGGRIVEDGTYQELSAEQGFFAELVARQQLDQTVRL